MADNKKVEAKAEAESEDHLTITLVNSTQFDKMVRLGDGKLVILEGGETKKVTFSEAPSPAYAQRLTDAGVLPKGEQARINAEAEHYAAQVAEVEAERAAVAGKLEDLVIPAPPAPQPWQVGLKK